MCLCKSLDDDFFEKMMHAWVAACTNTDAILVPMAPLHDAVRGGDLNSIVDILNAGADVDEMADQFAKTALMIAVEYKREDVVRCLLQRGAKVDLRDTFNSTVIHYVRDRACLLALLEHDVDVNDRDTEGNTVLTDHHHNDEVFLALIEHGADIHARNELGDTVLMNAPTTEQMLILIERGASIHETNHDGETALMWKANHNEAMVRALIEHGADVNAKCGSGKTALMRAADCPMSSIVRALLELGADVDARDEDGDTALVMAAKSGCMDCVIMIATESKKRAAERKEHAAANTIQRIYRAHLYRRRGIPTDPLCKARLLAEWCNMAV
jgi:ankyrin repeat protein